MKKTKGIRVWITREPYSVQFVVWHNRRPKYDSELQIWGGSDFLFNVMPGDKMLKFLSWFPQFPESKVPESEPEIHTARLYIDVEKGWR